MTCLDGTLNGIRLQMYLAMYNGATVNFGQTGLGETIGSQPIKRGLTVNPLNEQGSNKAKLVEDLGNNSRARLGVKYLGVKKSKISLKDYISVL